MCRIKLCAIKIIDIIPRNKRNSREAAIIRRNHINTIHDLLDNFEINRHILIDICLPELRAILSKLLTIDHIDHETDLLSQTKNYYAFDNESNKWSNLAIARSSDIRKLLHKDIVINQTKLNTFGINDATLLYKKILKINSVSLRTKILRLIHGDVYCGTRLVKFGMSEFDTCIRCFMPETIDHLLRHCPYSSEIWSKIGVSNETIPNILDISISDVEFEIRCALIEILVFRKLTTSPDRAIEIIMNRYAKGQSNKTRTVEYATRRIMNYKQNGLWQ